MGLLHSNMNHCQEGVSTMTASHKDLQTARELKERVSKLTKLIDYRLFGSRARGDAGEYSDMDIFMEFETIDRALKNRVKNEAWEVSLKSGIIITTLLFSRYEIEESPLRSSPIVRVIMDEGIPV
jgi:predicted nucleotidyltransferase